MYRFAGLRCPHRECHTFVVLREIFPAEPVPEVGVLDLASGTCPKCRGGFTVLADKMEVLETEKRPVLETGLTQRHQANLEDPRRPVT